MLQRKWFKKTAGCLLLVSGVAGCPQGLNPGPRRVDPVPVIGDHSEQRDRGAPALDEAAMTAELDGTAVRVHVPLADTGALSALDTVSLRVAVIDGQSEEEKASATATALAREGAADVSLQPATPLVTDADGLGALGRYILVVEASNHAGTTRVRRDLFRLINYLDVQLVAPQTAAAGGTFVLRAHVADRRGAAAMGETVHGILRDGSGNILAETTRATDANGDAELAFAAPDAALTSVAVSVEVGPGGARGRWQGAVTLEQGRNVLLTTDKPRYQPGQMMHLRALAFTGADRAPYAGPVVFEVQDARGNLLFKQAATANSFGVASTQFRVGARVNEGTWKARVGLGTDGRTGPVARQVTVEKYVLPRFKVEVAATAAQLRPGESTLVTVHAGYTFGVALNGGSAHLQATMKGQLVADQVAALTPTGDAQFTVSAPSTPDGRVAPLELAVEVTDAAGGKVTGTHAVNVVPMGLVAQAWWRDQANVGGRNTLYVQLTDPAGSPVRGNVVLQGTGTSTATDETGLAIMDVTVSANSYFYVEASAAGQYANAYLQPPADSAGLRVRVDPPVLAEGQPLTVTVEAADAAAGTATLDVYVAGSLVQSLPVTLEADGTGTATLPSAPGGLIRLVARHQGTGALGLGAAFARADRALRVGVDALQDTYRPRDTAAVRVSVKDGAGAGVASALGLTVVDEAVYALADVSGPVKAFAEGDAMDAPAGLDADAVLQPSNTGAAQRARAEAVLAYGRNAPGLLRADLGAGTRQRAAIEAMGLVQKDANDIGAAAYNAGIQPWSGEADALYNWLVEQQFLDPWGNAYQLSNQYSSYYGQLTSAGPDELPGTSDDMVGYVYVGGGWDRGGAFEGDANAGPPQAGGVAGEPGPAGSTSGTSATGGSGNGSPQLQVRREFPETLLVQPMVITDENGIAQVDLSLADSITTWRVGAVASDNRGRMGVGAGGVRVFQDFFVDLDVPTQLTEGDEVAITAVINNFMAEPQAVTLIADAGAWGEILSGQGQTLTVPAVSVAGATVRIRANRVGTFPLAIRASGAGLQDALVRNVRVAPGGEERAFTKSDRLVDVSTSIVDIPADATPGGTELTVRVSPGVSSEVVNGLDSMLQMPSGCFEQTSSSNYPNVLVMEYMRVTGQTNAQVEEKALRYMQEGYQRLTSYEVDGGGFSWFGDAPAHNVLTAYGLMEFVDMARVFPVDAALIARTATWLAGQQKSDGSFEATQGGIAEGAINAYTSTFRTTAFLAWALQRAGSHDDAVQRAVSWLSLNASTATDPYALAMYVNLLAAVDAGHADLPGATASLLAVAHDNNDAVSFPGSPPSQLAPCGGDSNTQTDLEVTAVAAHGLIQAQAAGDVATKALTFLVRNKDSFGTWQSTQATIRSLQALIASLGANTESAQGTVTVKLDGQEVGSFTITPDNASLMRVVDLSERATPGQHVVEVTRTGTGNFQYQVSGRSFVPRGAPQAPRVAVTTEFSTLSPAVGEAVDVTTTVTAAATFEQLFVDLPVPPGFDAETDGLEALRTAGRVSRVELQQGHVHIYAPGLRSGEPLALPWRIRPRLAARVTAPPVVAYAYYDPTLRGESQPVTLTVP
ncbi:MAG: hypothetical protein HY904_20375 [Deltaproteobacteria bacterium]|nr:hypothetical protein [Deltaproteobacteria bacterium]